MILKGEKRSKDKIHAKSVRRKKQKNFQNPLTNALSSAKITSSKAFERKPVTVFTVYRELSVGARQ